MEELQIERDAAIVTVTLNRPEKKNAVIPPMWVELGNQFDQIARDPSVRAVVVTGAGGDFCSGADLWAPPGDEEPPHQLLAMRTVGRAIQGLHDLPQPTIAKVPGVAAGAGCSLALACDLVVASEGARFSEIFAKRGLALDGGSSWLLPRMIGLHKAKELAFFADILSAAEAAEIGLVNRVVAADELDGFVAEWAARLAAGPPIALSLSKRMLNNATHVTLAQALEDEGRSQAVTLATSDTREAFAAFVEKREPTFRGR